MANSGFFRVESVPTARLDSDEYRERYTIQIFCGKDLIWSKSFPEKVNVQLAPSHNVVWSMNKLLAHVTSKADEIGSWPITQVLEQVGTAGEGGFVAALFKARLVRG